jgi:hypothetical protein
LSETRRQAFHEQIGAVACGETDRDFHVLASR